MLREGRGREKKTYSLGVWHEIKICIQIIQLRRNFDRNFAPSLPTRIFVLSLSFVLNVRGQGCWEHHAQVFIISQVGS